jgi:hypothetical protein
MTDEEARLRAAIQLIWSIHVRKHVHLGLERASGLRCNCIPCICALALGRSMDGAASKEEFEVQLEAVKHDDGQPEQA